MSVICLQQWDQLPMLSNTAKSQVNPRNFDNQQNQLYYGTLQKHNVAFLLLR